MKYSRLGNSGLQVSKICIGCMSFGASLWQDWVLNEDESLEVLKKAWDLGINFYDTADVYSNGRSEVILGNFMKKYNIPRSQIVIATKCYFNVHENDHRWKFSKPDEQTYVENQNDFNQRGNSRKHLFDAVERSLARLQTDYIDLFQIHRWDYETPAEETMEALHDLVKMGKVRYIGASSMPAWIFQKANSIAEKNRWTKFISMQNMYNLLYREEEREMIPYLVDQGIGMINYSPLARGIFSSQNGSTLRSNSDRIRGKLDNETQSSEAIKKAVISVANKKGVSPSQVALAWVLSKPFVSSPIVGCRKIEHLEEAVAALSIKLSDDEIEELECNYTPRNVENYLINKNQY